MKKVLCASLALLLAAGCSAPTAGGNDASASQDANYIFTSDLSTLDYMISMNTSDNEINTNLVDGLVEVNNLKQYVGALAESWDVNDDQTEWTFHLRDANWVTNNGEEYAPVTAQDFVTGLRHVADFKGQTVYIGEMFIKGLADYDHGTGKWEDVGIEAVDDKTVKYTLTEPTPYFDTVASYTTFLPINQEFLESQGDGCKLGAPDPTNCNFGSATDPSSILYNGGYILDEFVSKSSIRMHKNENYWDAENVHINNVNLVYDDGSDPASTVKGFEQKDNPYFIATLLSSSDNFEEYLNQYKDYAYTGQQNQYTFGVNFNMNRVSYNITDKNEKQQSDTREALLNKNFRRALKFGFDRVAYLQTFVDKSIAVNAIRNIESPWDLVTTSDGTNYGELVQKYSEDPSIDLSEGQDSLFNSEKAQEELATAKTALPNVTWPVVLDVLAPEKDSSLVAAAASMEQSIESALGKENIDIVVHPVDEDTYSKSSYTATGPVDCDWDISTSTGWGYDYVDPKSYLNIFSPLNGDVLRQSMSLEFYKSTDSTPQNDAAIEKCGLLEYQKILDEAYAITTDLDARYNAEAKAEAFMLDNVFTIPVQVKASDVNWRISRQVPFTEPYRSPKYKGRVIQAEPVTAKEYKEAYDQWQKDVLEASKKD